MSKSTSRRVDRELRPALTWLEGVAGVSRLIVGPASACRHHYPPGFVRVRRESPGGLDLVGYGGKGLVSFRLMIPRPADVVAARAVIGARFGTAGEGADAT